MPKTQRSLSPGPGDEPTPTGHAPEQTDEVGSLAIVAALLAFVSVFYVALVALYVLGSLGIGVMLRVVGFGPWREGWGHLLFRACSVSAIVVLVVLALGTVALLCCRTEGSPPAT